MLVPSPLKINNSAAGIQTPLTLKGQGGLDTCCTIIDFLQTGNQQIIKKWSIGVRARDKFPPVIHEPRRQKTGLRGFRPGPIQTGLRNYWMRLETWNFRFRKYRGCTIRVAKTKALISFAVTAKLICVFVFAYAKIRFSHVAAHM